MPAPDNVQTPDDRDSAPSSPDNCDMSQYREPGDRVSVTIFHCCLLSSISHGRSGHQASVSVWPDITIPCDLTIASHHNTLWQMLTAHYNNQRANNCLCNPHDMCIIPVSRSRVPHSQSEASIQFVWSLTTNQKTVSRHDMCIIPGQTGASSLQIYHVILHHVIISLFVCSDHPGKHYASWLIHCQ